MATSQLKNLVLVPVLISAAVFSTLTLPLALLGSKPVVIRLQEEPVFDGRLRDIATPYLGLAGLLSLGAGVATLAVTGWRQSLLNSAQFQQQLLGIQQHLKEKEELLEKLRLSESRLETSGLSTFLDAEKNDKASIEQHTVEQHISATENTKAEPVAIEMPVQVELGIAKELGEMHHTASLQAVPSRKAQTAASAFQSAQTFLGFAQANTLYSKPTAVGAEDSTTALLPVEELQSQIKQLMSQIEALQSSLQLAPQQVTPEVNQVITPPMVHSHQQSQILESWLMHKVAS